MAGSLRTILCAAVLTQVPLPAQAFEPVHGPQNLFDAVYDLRRQRAVFAGDMRGGISPTEMFVADGTRFLWRPNPAGSPQPVQGSGELVWDSLRSRVFRASTGVDPWTWDGVAWSQLPSASKPPARSFAATAYDGPRDRVVLFGGTSFPSTTLLDTWEHDGTQWVQRTPATVPPAGTGRDMVYDSAAGTCVMVLHDWIAGVPQPVRVWQWDGANWSDVTPPGTSPLSAGTGGATLTYDPLRARTVLTVRQFASADIWEWDGAAWTLAASSAALAQQAGMSFFDPVQGAVVIAFNNPYGEEFFEAFAYDGSQLATWQREYRPSFDAVPFWFDADRGRAMLGAEWAWDASGWTQLTGGPTTIDAAATHDGTNGVSLWFGGTTLPFFTPVDDFWQWDGATWTQLFPPTAPPARESAGMAYDSARGRAVLFGGCGAGSQALADTWEWDGASWMQRTPATAPPAGPAVLAFDAARSRTVAFSNAVPGTWEWDGTSWQQIVTGNAPAGFVRSMTYDAARQVCHAIRPVGFGREEWFYDGTDWTAGPITNGPGSSRQGVAYDTLRQVVLAYEGLQVSEFTDALATSSTFGAGCGVPEPRLAPRVRARIGDPDFGLELLAEPLDVCGIAISTTTGSTPIGGGCTIHVGPSLVSALLFADQNGFTTLPLALPLSPALRGLTFHAQAGAIDVFTNVISLSRGVSFTLGD